MIRVWGIEHTRYLAKMRSPSQRVPHIVPIIVMILIALIIIAWVF